MVPQGMDSLRGHLLKALATWFGLGKLPFAPGTMGTIGAIPLVYFVNDLGPNLYLIITFLTVVAAVIVAQVYDDFYAQTEDPSEFVLDEVAGFMITMAWVPLTWTGWLLGFALFRLLDALKPFPISWVERKASGGFGIVIDDVVAGLIANVILQVLIHQGFL